MSLKNTATSYGSIAKFFHWTIFILLFFMIIYGYFLDSFPKDYKKMASNIHKLIGLVILLLMILRAGWALMNTKPQLDMRIWEHYAERTLHLLLYVVIILMPIAGWIGASAANKPPHIGDYAFRLPIEENKPLVKIAFNIHGWLAIIIITFVSLHILAALYHHFIRKDGVLRRMMPNR